MTTKELAKILRVSRRTACYRCRESGISMVLKNGRWTYDLTKEQAMQISKSKPKKKNPILGFVDFIRIETTYYIYPSKLNYLEV